VFIKVRELKEMRERERDPFVPVIMVIYGKVTSFVICIWLKHQNMSARYTPFIDT
jgi:hypothetical protein